MTTWNLQGTRHHVLVCGGSSCNKRGGDAVEAAVESEIEALGAEALVHVTRTKCNGRCGDACVVIAYPDGIWYRGLTPQGGRELVGAMLRGEPPLEQASYVFGEDGMQPVHGKSKGKLKRGKVGEFEARVKKEEQPNKEADKKDKKEKKEKKEKNEKRGKKEKSAAKKEGKKEKKQGKKK